APPGARGAEGGAVRLEEVDDELMVSLRARQPRVYDPVHSRIPAHCGLGDLTQDAAVDLRVADHAFPHLGPAALELRLHGAERLPARPCEPQSGRARRTHGAERDVA